VDSELEEFAASLISIFSPSSSEDDEINSSSSSICKILFLFFSGRELDEAIISLFPNTTDVVVELSSAPGCCASLI
jgi:hypothetical protein